MARGFSATLGAGTTDRITTGLATGVSIVYSAHCWAYWRASGGGGFGRIFDGEPTDAGHYLIYNGTGYQANMGFDGTNGAWGTDTAPGSSVWEPIGLSYDGGATTNDPIFYQNNVKKTVGAGVTEIATPTGTITPNGGAIYIGNRLDSTRAWDGMLAEFAVWNVILTDDEFASLGKGYSPLLIRPNAITCHVPMLRNNTDSKFAAPTIVGTAVQPHPNIIMPTGDRG